MTERAEIERLLNMTGRTLERLPELYPLAQCEDAIRRSGVSVGMAGNMICHQSDVIELLLGALRDALDKQPKWIGVNERLPDIAIESNRMKVTESVLAVDSCGFVHVGVFRIYAYDNSSVFVGVDTEYFDESLTDITHWMPLPEPPKEK